MNAKQWAAKYLTLSVQEQYAMFDALWAEDGSLSTSRPEGLVGPCADDNSDLPEGGPREDRRFIGRRLLYRPCGQWYVAI